MPVGRAPTPWRKSAARWHDDASVESYSGCDQTFGTLPGAMRGLPFDRRVEALLADRDDLAAIVRPMLTAWRQLREQIAVLDKAVRTLAKNDRKRRGVGLTHCIVVSVGKFS